jgi:eukaryotic translation initiation factor 2C
MRWLVEKKTMMVGIDVTHPKPKSRKGMPSIAAVVASVDDNFVQFPASLRIQKGRKEVNVIDISPVTDSTSPDAGRTQRHVD